MAGSCLTEDDYEGVLGDSLRAEERVRVAIHVSECQDCRTALEERRLVGPTRRPADSPRVGNASGTPVAKARRRWSAGVPWALLVVVLILGVYVSLQLTGIIDRQRRELAAGGGALADQSRAQQEAELHRDRLHLASSALDDASPSLLQDLLGQAPESARLWAWQRLHAMSDRATSRQAAGAGGVASLAISAGGRCIVGGRDGRIRVPARDRGEKVLEWPAHDGAVLALALSPDGKTIASGGEDRNIRLWRLADGSLLHTLEGHSWSVLDLCFESDGSVLVSAGRDETVVHSA